MSDGRPGSADGGIWIVVPQAVSRAVAVFVFAVAARALDAELLGALAVATALTAGAGALAPAVVGKPLAVLDSPELRARSAPQAQSFAVLAALAAAVLLGIGSVFATGPVHTILLAAAIGVPATTAVETHYWRTVFLRGRRRAGLGLSAAYVVQAAAIAGAAVAGGDTAVVLSPFLGLAAAGLVLLSLDGGLSLSGARAWIGAHRPRWLPYVYGVAAAVALAQAVPVLLALVAGLPAASTYRAGELVFGLTNLLIGIAVQTQLTQAAGDLRRTYARSAGLLVTVALLNGLVVAVVPVALLESVVGPVADRLQGVLASFTVLRAALGVASVGAVLLVRRLSARSIGLLGVASAALSCALLVAGLVVGGLQGGLVGLAAAELVIAACYAVLLRRRS